MNINDLTKLAAVLIIASSVVLMAVSAWDDAPIVDEIPHIGSGYSYVATGDFRLNPEHPPLAKDLSGISLKLLGIEDQPAFDSRFWQEDINGQWEFGRKLIFGSGNDANVLVRFAKFPQLVFFILSAVIIFIWTRKLYGYSGALIAIFLFSFSPTVMAHSRFVTTDVPALFGILLGTFFFVNYLKNSSNKNLVLAGLALGVAELTKFSVFLLVPFFLILAVIYGMRSNNFIAKLKSTLYYLFTTSCIVAIGYIFVVWPVYILHTKNYPPEEQRRQTIYNLGSYGNRFFPEIMIWMSDKPLLNGLSQYGTGLLMVTQRSIGGNDTYFLGEVKNVAWKKYFPIVYFIKEPLAFWGLLILVWIYWSVKVRFEKNIFKQCWRHCIDFVENHFTELAMLIWLAIYWYASITANLNIGVRHLMPTYGFVFILLAGQLVKICARINSKKILTVYYLLLVTLFGWYLCENLKVYPFYLTYFNQVAGGPAGGHRYVVDSNLDWGQDLKRLADWVEKYNNCTQIRCDASQNFGCPSYCYSISNPPPKPLQPIKNLHLDYFGWADTGFYLKDKVISLSVGKYKNPQEFLADNPEGGYIAISASYYMGSVANPETSYAWLNKYEPVIVIGNSIFVWHIAPIVNSTQ